MKGIKWKRNGLAILAVMLCAVLAAGMAACGGSGSSSAASGSGSGSASGSATASSAAGGKTFVYGTTGYGVSMEDNGLDPHNGYFGWSCLRYGVGETLFKFSDAMEPEPWGMGWGRGLQDPLALCGQGSGRRKWGGDMVGRQE